MEYLEEEDLYGGCRPRDEYKWTTNRKAYNRLRKKVLESDGDIRCSYCPYNGGENDKGKWYGGYVDENGYSKKGIRYPSWKLATKKRKQWMKGSFKKKIEKSRYWKGHYVTIEFDRNHHEW